MRPGSESLLAPLGVTGLDGPIDKALWLLGEGRLRGWERRKIDEVIANAAAELEKARHNLANLESCIARRSALEDAIRHVIDASPGTPGSVKKYLVRTLEGSWGATYEHTMVDGPLGHPEAS